MLLRIIIYFLLNRINRMSYIIESFFLFSLWVHSLLPLVLLLFDIRLLPEEHKDVEGFTTDAILLATTLFLGSVQYYQSVLHCFFVKFPSLYSKTRQYPIKEHLILSVCPDFVLFRTPHISSQKHTSKTFFTEQLPVAAFKCQLFFLKGENRNNFSYLLWP